MHPRTERLHYLGTLADRCRAETYLKLEQLSIEKGLAQGEKRHDREMSCSC